MTAEAHALIGHHLRPGHRVLDATAGQGYDSLFLAQQVAPGGHLMAVDLQAEAVEETRKRLCASALAVSCDIRQGSHTDLAKIFPDWLETQLDGAIFNLGYLPGGNHAITTTARGTLDALDTVWSQLKERAPLVVVCYPGHPAGAEESAAVEGWFANLATTHDIAVESRRIEGTRRPAPFVLMALAPAAVQ